MTIDRHAELRTMLHRLRLPAFADHFADFALRAAKEGLTHESFLYELARAECVQRGERRIARLLHESGLPRETMTTMAAIDRVVHHSVILDLMGVESYRAKEASDHQEQGGPPHEPEEPAA